MAGDKRLETFKTASGAERETIPTPGMLVREHAPAVLGLCLAHTRNLHDGEDIMQDVFLKAFENLPPSSILSFQKSVSICGRLAVFCFFERIV